MQTPATEVKWLITQTNWPVKSTLNVLDYHVQKHWLHYVISSFRREVYENCFVLHYYAACSGNSLPTFRSHLLRFFTLKMGPICCPETQVRNYYNMQRNNQRERSSHWFHCCISQTVYFKPYQEDRGYDMKLSSK